MNAGLLGRIFGASTYDPNRKPGALPALPLATHTLQALAALGEACGGRDVWFNALLSDIRPENRWRALLYITAAGIPGVRPDLHEELSHPDSRVRAWTCYALGEGTLPGSIEHLQQMPRDSSRRVRYQARRALAVRGARRRGRPYGTGNPAVIVSDDDPQVQAHLTGLLRESGIPCAAASTVEETIQKARALQAALIITDNQKQDDNTSGLHMAERFSRDDELKEILLLMLSVDRIGGAFLWHGGDAYLHKVDDLDDLGPLVRAMLSV